VPNHQSLSLSLSLPLSLSLQNPDIVLVHYLNVPAIEDCGKPCGPILCSINTDKKEWAKWSKEELIGQLKPMCEYLTYHIQYSSRPLSQCNIFRMSGD